MPRDRDSTVVFACTSRSRGLVAVLAATGAGLPSNDVYAAAGLVCMDDQATEDLVLGEVVTSTNMQPDQDYCGLIFSVGLARDEGFFVPEQKRSVFHACLLHGGKKSKRVANTPPPSPLAKLPARYFQPPPWPPSSGPSKGGLGRCAKIRKEWLPS